MKTVFYNQIDHLVLKQNTYHYLTLALRDMYDNVATSVPDLLTMVVRKVSTSSVYKPALYADI